MKIEVKGRNLPVSDDLKERITRRFRVIEKQVSELAQLEVEIYEDGEEPPQDIFLGATSDVVGEPF